MSCRPDIGGTGICIGLGVTIVEGSIIPKKFLNILRQNMKEKLIKMPPLKLKDIINKAKAEGRILLNEVESKEFISKYGIKTTKPLIAKNENEAVKLARILKEIGVDNLQVKPYSHHPQRLRACGGFYAFQDQNLFC